MPHKRQQAHTTMKLTIPAAKTSLFCHAAAVAVLGLSAGLSHAQNVTLQDGNLGTQFRSENLTFGETLNKTPATLGASSYKESTNGASFWVYCLDPLTSITSPLNYTKLTGSGNGALNQFITTAGTPSNFTSYNEQFGKTGGDYAKAALGNSNVANSKYDDQTAATAGNARVLSKITDLFSYAYADATLTNSLTKSAAFQYALWEVLGDTKGTTGNWLSYSSTTGGLREGTTWGGSSDLVNVGYSTALKNQIDVYLAALNTGNWAGIGTGKATNYTFTVYNSSTSQTLVSVTPQSNGVPEPGSLALAGLALFGVVYTRRQSKAQKN